MRKTLLLLVALAPLAALGGMALPAAAESEGGACATQPAAAGPLELDKIPAQPVTGLRAIHGMAVDDECDGPVAGKAGGRALHAAIRANDDGAAGQAEIDN